MQHVGAPGSGSRTAGFSTAQAEPQLPSVLVSGTQMSSLERHESDVSISQFVFPTHIVKGQALLLPEEFEHNRSVVDEAAGEVVSSQAVECHHVSPARGFFQNEVNED